jgi:hypothetical protein
MPKVLKKKNEKIICDYCFKKFKTNGGLIKHSSKCVIRNRFSLQEAPTSKLAHLLWCKSFKDSTRKKFDFNTFINHREYNFFINLAAFCIKLDVIDSISYMNWCYDNKLKIALWNIESSYEKYIKYFIVHEDPIEAVKRSVQYILNKTNLNIKEFLISIKSGILLNMLELGRISPWIIILSKNYDWSPLKNFNKEQITMYNNIVDQSIWSVLQKKHIQKISELEKYFKEIN